MDQVNVTQPTQYACIGLVGCYLTEEQDMNWETKTVTSEFMSCSPRARNEGKRANINLEQEMKETERINLEQEMKGREQIKTQRKK